MSGDLFQPDDVVHIELSDEERDTGHITPRHLYDAVDAFNNDGVVVLDNAVPVEVVDKFNERMTEETNALLELGENLFWGQGEGHGNLIVAPPLDKEYLFPEYYGNKPAARVIEMILGPQPEARFIASNTTIPNLGVRQPVHKDCRFLHPRANYNVAMNMCLIDVSPEMGSTEFWLGTNHESPNTDWVEPGNSHVHPDKVEARRKIRPPIQPTVKKGGIILRDQRCWHAGMPNLGNKLRVMTSVLYFARWFANGHRLKMPKSVQPIIADLEKRNNTVFVVDWVDDDKFDYKSDNQGFGFETTIHPELFEPFKDFAEERLRRIGADPTKGM